MEKNNKKDIFNKQVELYFKEVSKAVETATDKCIETDGKVLPHSIAVGLGKTLGASLAAFTKGASDSVANDIIATLFKSTVPETKKQFWVGPFCITVNKD